MGSTLIQDPQETQQNTSFIGRALAGKLTPSPEDISIMKDVALAMGPRQGASDSLQALALEDESESKGQEKTIAIPEELGSMWDAAKAKGDFSAVNAEMAKAISAAYAKGGIPAVKALKNQIYDNIKTEAARPILVKTGNVIDIHNIEPLPKSDTEAFEKMSEESRKNLGVMDVAGLGWVKKVGPSQNIALKERSQIKPETEIEHRVKSPDSHKENKVPEVRQFRLPDGNSVSVHRNWGFPKSGEEPTWDKYGVDEIYIGESGHMKWADVQRMERNTDGGTSITTNKGTLFIPGKNEGNRLPTWTTKKEDGSLLNIPIAEQKLAESMDKQISAAAQSIAEKLVDGKVSESEVYALESSIHQIFAQFGRNAVHDKLIPQTKNQLEKMSSNNYGLRYGNSLLNVNGLSLEVYKKQAGENGEITGGLMYIMNNDPDALQRRRALDKISDPEERKKQEFDDYINREFPREPK